MAAPPHVHILCLEEVLRLCNAIGDEVAAYLLAFIGGEIATADNLTGTLCRGAMLAKAGEVWNGTIDLTGWTSHNLNGWPLPPYEEGL